MRCKNIPSSGEGFIETNDNIEFELKSIAKCELTNIMEIIHWFPIRDSDVLYQKYLNEITRRRMDAIAQSRMNRTRGTRRYITNKRDKALSNFWNKPKEPKK